MDAFFNFINSPRLLGIFLKLFGIIAGSLYILFALVMIKQISLMKETVDINDQGILRISALIQLGLAIVIVVYALFIL